MQIYTFSSFAPGPDVAAIANLKGKTPQTKRKSIFTPLVPLFLSRNCIAYTRMKFIRKTPWRSRDNSVFRRLPLGRESHDYDNDTWPGIRRFPS